MTIRPATIDDAAAIAHVHVESWRTTFRHILPADYLAGLSKDERKERWVTTLGNLASPGFTLVAQSEGEIVAFASGGPERKGDPDYAGELYAIYLLEPFQRQGIGTRLFRTVTMRLLERGLSSMKIWALKDNPARGFYERRGGVLVEEGPIKIGELDMRQVAYGWRQLES
ncbi:MAG TPA: GNAT family N-acetyltransferase [Pirellulales bacterium]|nr:GNAT family N-acetyltransferase [Pirellulales bacterium]